MVFSANTFAQKFSISGTVKDAKNGEGLIGAPVSIKELPGTGVATNVYGFYSISLPKGKYTISISYLGYATVNKEIELDKDIKLDVDIEETSKELKEVEISSEREDKNVRSMEMSVQKLDIKTINKIPALLGEVDVIRSIQLLPGVATVGEGASGFNVRGGGVDQNLILMDEAPVYNSSHLFGFFSVFNPDAVKDVKLIKGGIPAQYGGRLSSLLDVRLKDGNNKKLSAQGGIGTIFSRLTIEAPIVKNKGSFILAGRRSYFDQFFIFAKNKDIKTAVAYFYDFTAKANYTFNDKNRVFLSSYLGRDKFRFGGKEGFGFDWGNATGTLRWNHVYNSKVFSNVSAIYSNYDYSIGAGNTEDGFSWKSKIINYSIKPEFTWYLNPRNQITFGGTSTIYDFDPGKLVFYSKSEKKEVGAPSKYTWENALYAGNEQTLNGRFSIQYGLRFSNFNYIGPGTAYTFKDSAGNYRKDTISSKKYDDYDLIKTYNNLEPRFSVKFETSEHSSIKASYNRMAQYLHLISNTVASTPLDVWTPSTNNIKPQLADQVALGYFRNFGKNDMFESSVEVYYKKLQNQVDYIDGANLFLNPLLEAELMSGKGRAYGAEFYIRKTKGKINGWISYTLSRTERLVKGINEDNWYPNRYDKPHNLSVVCNYDILDRLSAGANFVYSSGTPATFPTTRVPFQGYVIPYNEGNARNNVRIPAYHRLDLSVTYEFKKKIKDHFESNIVFSCYNVYGRKNPFGFYFRSNPGNPQQTQAVQFAVIGRPIPAITFNFKF